MLWLLPLLAYGGWALLLFVAQRRVLFPGTELGGLPLPEGAVPSLQALWVDAPEGRVEAWYLPARSASRGPEVGEGGSGPTPGPAVVFTHGNYELIDHWVHEFEPLRERGVGVLLVEYPGYGRSEGTPSEASVAAAMEAAFDSLTQRSEVDPGRIVAWGRSLGGGAACALAARRPVAALVLQSSFTGVAALAARQLLPPFLVRDPFDNLAVVRDYDGPVLVAHGRRDPVIPFSHGEALYRTASRGTFLPFDCAHNDCPPDWRVFVGQVVSFLETHGLLDAADAAPRPSLGPEPPSPPP